jgi:hypothetical protein
VCPENDGPKRQSSRERKPMKQRITFHAILYFQISEMSFAVVASPNGAMP